MLIQCPWSKLIFSSISRKIWNELPKELLFAVGHKHINEMQIYFDLSQQRSYFLTFIFLNNSLYNLFLNK